MADSKREQFRHFTPMNVHWGDMDSLGHVNNVIYFRYVETGRIAYFNALMGDSTDIWGGEGPILAEIQCQFIKQMHYPADLEVGTRTARIGGRSITLEAAVFRKGEDEPVAISRAAVVWFNYQKQTSVPVSDAVRIAIRQLEVVPPEE